MINKNISNYQAIIIISRNNRIIIFIILRFNNVVTENFITIDSKYLKGVIQQESDLTPEDKIKNIEDCENNIILTLLIP